MAGVGARRRVFARGAALLASAIAVMLVAVTEPSAATVAEPSAATGMIVTVPGAALVDGETFTINDGAGELTTFEFDSNGSVTPGNAAVTFAAANTAGTVASSITAAVNSSAVAVTAFGDGSAAVQLVNDNVGSAGNQAIAEAVSSPEFRASGMSGGTDSATVAEPSAATGMIVTVPGAALVDGETFTINDGAGELTTFEFDSNGSVTPGNAAVTFAAANTAGTVASSITAAVNSSAVAVTAFGDGSAAVQLVNDNVGSAGNQAIAEAVASPEFRASGMSGGTDDAPATRSATLTSSRQKVVFGRNFTLSGEITSTDPLCVSGVSVDIARDILGGTVTFAPLTTVTTGSGGEFSLGRKADRSATYRALAQATASCDATSAQTTVHVNKKVTLGASGTQVASGSPVRLRAGVAPCAGHQGDPVVFQKKTPSGFKSIARKAASSQCVATLRVIVTKTTIFRAVAPKSDADHISGTSPTRRVRSS
jgi:hypothetical protein